MTEFSLIAPTSLRDYAKAQGWNLLLEAARDRLYVMSNPAFARRQLVFPMDTNAPDYGEAVHLMIEKLAQMEDRTPSDVLKSVVEVGDDAYAFRITSPRHDDQSLPLSFAGSMVQGAQQLLLAAACTVLAPKVHHPRLSKIEAQQFLERSRFRHTQPGSFVLNVSCPVQALDVQAPLPLGEAEAPFVRRASIVVCQSLGKLVSAIETDSVEALINEAKASEVPLLSSNFCEALTRFEDEGLLNSLDVEIRWAASIPRPADQPTYRARVQHDYFPRIEEIRRELRSAETETEGVFIGTVERLDGEMDENQRRAGEVILSLLLPEGDQVRARTNLEPDRYAMADTAHMTQGTYVKVVGRLRPGRQPRQLTDLTAFELVRR